MPNREGPAVPSATAASASPPAPEKLMPGGSDETGRRRHGVLAGEGALKDQREGVAERRRGLPLGGRVPEDYRFQEGPADLGDAAATSREVRLSELFAPGKDELIVIHYMFGAASEKPCPMCTMWAEGYNGVAPHVGDKGNFALVAKADLAKLRAWARGRGWTNLRLLSSRDNSFNRDYHCEDESCTRRPSARVFCPEPP